MKDITIQGRELAVDFEWSQQGHRLTVMEWDGTDWQTLPNYNGVLCILSTQFESLCGVASELFDEAVWAEEMAHKLGIPVRFYDDADCVDCGSWYDYEEMFQRPNGDYVCQDCGIDNDL